MAISIIMSNSSKNFIIASYLTVIMVLNLELALRVLGFTAGVYPSHRLMPYQFDSELGWVPRPSTRYLRVSPEYLHFNYYNKDGFPTSEANWKE
jgi:hypothetical protein